MKHEFDVCEVCFGVHQGDQAAQAYDVDMLIADEVVRMRRSVDLCDRCSQRMADLGIIRAVTLSGMSPSDGIKRVKPASEASKPEVVSMKVRVTPRRDREGLFQDLLARLGSSHPPTPLH
jgi:hypothetical protein